MFSFFCEVIIIKVYKVIKFNFCFERKSYYRAPDDFIGEPPYNL